MTRNIEILDIGTEGGGGTLYLRALTDGGRVFFFEGTQIDWDDDRDEETWSEWSVPESTTLEGALPSRWAQLSAMHVTSDSDLRAELEAAYNRSLHAGGSPAKPFAIWIADARPFPAADPPQGAHSPAPPSLRVVSWNMRRADKRNPAWDLLVSLSPDVALLQEVSSVPDAVLASYQIHQHRPSSKSDGEQRFWTAVLVRGQVADEGRLTSHIPWIDADLARYAGNLLHCRVIADGHAPIHVVSVYSPAWPVPRSRLAGVDLTGVKLDLNRDLWVIDLLTAALREREHLATERWIIAGDFNTSETFDACKGGPRGNREFLDRMATLGFTECLRHAQGRLTPTFRNPKGGVVAHQMDHVFVSQALAGHLRACTTGEHDVVFGSGLSDHLPIVATLGTVG